MNCLAPIAILFDTIVPRFRQSLFQRLDTSELSVR
jgi:hypothetical protein